MSHYITLTDRAKPIYGLVEDGLGSEDRIDSEVVCSDHPFGQLLIRINRRALLAKHISFDK